MKTKILSLFIAVFLLFNISPASAESGNMAAARAEAYRHIYELQAGWTVFDQLVLAPERNLTIYLTPDLLSFMNKTTQDILHFGSPRATWDEQGETLTYANEEDVLKIRAKLLPQLKLMGQYMLASVRKYVDVVLAEGSEEEIRALKGLMTSMQNELRAEPTASLDILPVLAVTSPFAMMGAKRFFPVPLIRATAVALLVSMVVTSTIPVWNHREHNKNVRLANEVTRGTQAKLAEYQNLIDHRLRKNIESSAGVAN